MCIYKIMKARTLWVGIGGLAAFLSFAPRGNAQEVNPDRFTDTGLDGVWPSAALNIASNKPSAVSAVQSRSNQHKVQNVDQIRGVRYGIRRRLTRGTGNSPQR